MYIKPNLLFLFDLTKYSSIYQRLKIRSILNVGVKFDNYYQIKHEMQINISTLLFFFVSLICHNYHTFFAVLKQDY